MSSRPVDKCRNYMKTSFEDKRGKIVCLLDKDMFTPYLLSADRACVDRISNGTGNEEDRGSVLRAYTVNCINHEIDHNSSEIGRVDRNIERILSGKNCTGDATACYCVHDERTVHENPSDIRLLHPGAIISLKSFLISSPPVAFLNFSPSLRTTVGVALTLSSRISFLQNE